MNGKLRTSLALAACLAPAACSTLPNRQEHRTVHYLCDGGDTITATWFNAGSKHDVGLVVLDWKGEEYGLARAPSASGARYAGLLGPGVSGHCRPRD